MATPKEIKSRIQSIKNTQKTTKAMELVSGAKMRKAVGAAIQTRSYHQAVWSLLTRLRRRVALEQEHPLKRFFTEPSADAINTTIVVYTSNRGLCGAFNSNVIKQVIAYVREHPQERCSIIAVGKKGSATLTLLNLNVEQAYTKDDKTNTDASVIEIATALHRSFRDGTVDKVLVAYTDYKTAMVQLPQLVQLYPLPATAPISQDIAPVVEETTAQPLPTLYEPSKQDILSSLIPRAAEVQLYQALLESNASEHSSRMVAMKSATEAAAEMRDELILAFNRARQAAITKEIAEIAAGSAALGN